MYIKGNMASKHIRYTNDNIQSNIHKSIILIRLWLLIYLALTINCTTASLDVLPHPCDTIKCPSMSDIECPEDSEVRETRNPLTPLHESTTQAAVTEESFNTTEIADELFAQCCLAKKCICKTCYIHDCHNANEVVVELVPESIDIPGHCCGQYECRAEPNCTEVRETETYWLTNCKRCKCYSGERICHQSCDEGMKKSTAICNSENLNTFYEHGESWRDGCYDCECVNGEEKCVMPFCRSLNCPPNRQVILRDSCCPICWPKGVAMPDGNDEYDDDDPMGGDDDEYNIGAGMHSGNRIYENMDDAMQHVPETANNYDDTTLDTLPNIRFNEDANASSTVKNISAAASTKVAQIVTPTTTASSSSSSSNTTTDVPLASASPPAPAPLPLPLPSPTTPTTIGSSAAAAVTAASSILLDLRNTTTVTPPCMANARHELPATYQVYPEVVEVVRQTSQNDVLYVIIGILVLGLLGLGAWNIHLRAKQRSYRPVSNFDDNFNKTTSNIKKTNDYV